MSKMELTPQPGETFPAFKQGQAQPAAGKTPVLYGVFQVQRLTSHKKLVARKVMLTNKSLVLATPDNKLVTRLPFIVDIDSAFFRPPDTVCLTFKSRAHEPTMVLKVIRVASPGEFNGGPAERFLRILNFIRLKYADAEGQDIPCQRVSMQDDLTGHGSLDKKKVQGYKGPRSKMDDLATRKPPYLKLVPPPAPPEPEREPEPEYVDPPPLAKPEPELPPPQQQEPPAPEARAVPDEVSEEQSSEPRPARRRRVPRPPPSDYDDDDDDLDPGLAPLADHAPYPTRIPHMSALPPFASESPPPPQPLRSPQPATEPKAYPR
eukprot:Rhum_TRINITY_DN15106_c18_g1::Rhum_TRINITY_DN15106_c18_g1_i1::g.139847::m.139847